jgi:superfamily II DNA or RNA helicase
MDLRPYQACAIADCRAAYESGARGVVLVLPTGAGKTVIASEIARLALSRGGTVAVLCHRTELIAQTEDKLRAVGLTPGERVWVDSTQTAVRRPAREVSLLVLDECHHYASDLWGSLPERYVGALRLGLTATPQRADGRALSGFDRLVVGVTPRELTELGHLVPCDVLASPAGLADPVSAYREHCAGRPTILFAASLGEARRIASELGGACIDGEMRADDRASAIAAFRSGSLDLLTGMHVLTEGFDAPRAECCVIARGVGHAGTYLQMVGRVLRPALGKSRALVLDLSGAAFRHGLPTDDRQWSLEGKAHKLVKLASLTQCPSCGAVTRSAPVCLFCGFHAPPKPAPRYEQAVRLVRVDSVTPDDTKRAWLAKQTEIARSRGYKAGWAMHRFKQRFGHWPTAEQRRVRGSGDMPTATVPASPCGPELE